MAYPCGIGINDFEKCGAGKKCDPDTNECINPCADQATRDSYGLNGNGTWYQNDPDQPQYGECIQGVGANNPQQGNGQQQVNVNNSKSFSKKSLPTTNRFCLCAIDVGCGPTPPPVVEDLEFNILVLTSIVNKRNRKKVSVSLFGPRGKLPIPLPPSQNRRCEFPLFTISTPWKTRDDNNAICVEGPCCKSEANNPRKVGLQTECPTDIVSACEYLLEDTASFKNGKFTGYGENTAGCEHLSFWCSHHKGSWTSNSFRGRVPEIFDIQIDDYGAWTGFSVKTSAPPEGTTYEINIYGHQGQQGRCSPDINLWVHETNKFKTDNVRLTDSISYDSWNDSWFHDYDNKCPSTQGGPDPDFLKGKGPAEKLLGVITILPDGTWTLTNKGRPVDGGFGV